MAYHVRLEIAGTGTRYVANAALGDLLTRDREQARRFRSAMNADEAAGQ